MIRIPISKPTKPQIITFVLGAASLAVATFAPQYVAGFESLLQLLGVYAMGTGTPFAQPTAPVKAPS